MLIYINNSPCHRRPASAYIRFYKVARVKMLEELAANDPVVQVREAVRQALDEAAAADEATVGHVG